MGASSHAYVTLAALGALLGLVASSGAACKSDPDCTCAIDQSGEHRVIGCGDNACIGGIQFACTDGKATQTSGCTAPAPTDTSTSGPESGGPPPDHSCQDLQTFCDTSCRKPAAVSSDCISTAGAGDGAACAGWQSSNSSLCSQ